MGDFSQDGEFADNGDSRSIITNARWELVGLNNRPRELTAASFTPFYFIQDDVKKLMDQYKRKTDQAMMTLADENAKMLG